MLPRAFELAVLPGHSAHGYAGYHAPGHRAPGLAHHSGSTTDQMETLRQQVAAQMDAANLAMQGCSAVSATDMTTWNGIYSSWQAYSAGLQACTQYGGSGTAAGSYSCWTYSTGFPLYQWDPKPMSTFAAQANGYQQRVKQACPNYNPPPVPVPPTPVTPPGPTPSDGSQSWLCKNVGIGCPAAPAGAPADTWATAVKWIAIFGVIGITLWYVGPLVGAIAGGAAGAIQRRARGRVGGGGGGGEEYNIRPEAYV